MNKGVGELETAYRLAKQAFEAYGVATAELKRTAKKYGTLICREYTEKLHAERPDLVERCKMAYTGGERIREDMMLGGRWPQNGGTGKYLEGMRPLFQLAQTRRLSST